MSTHDIILIASIVVTAIVVWLIQRYVITGKLTIVNERLLQQLELTEQLQQTTKVLQAEKENLIQQVAAAQSQLQFLQEQYNLSKRYQKENEILTSQLLMFKSKFQAAEEKLEKQKKEMEQLGEHFKFEFRNLVQTILEERSENLRQSEQTAVFSGTEVQSFNRNLPTDEPGANNVTTGLEGNNKI